MGGTYFYLPSRQRFVFILKHTCICYYLPCLEEAHVKFCSNSHPCELYSFMYQTGALRLEHRKAKSVKGRVVDEHISLKTRFFSPCVWGFLQHTLAQLVLLPLSRSSNQPGRSSLLFSMGKLTPSTDLIRCDTLPSQIAHYRKSVLLLSFRQPSSMCNTRCSELWMPYITTYYLW